MKRRVAGFAAGLALSGAVAPGLHAQSARGWTSTTIQHVQLTPLAVDSLTGSAACGGEPDCLIYGSGSRTGATALSQDLSFVAWGLGMRGLSVTGRLRSRVQLGGELDWPRADDRFDAILAYAEYVRPRLRARVGRQRTNSGLGFQGYDGASVRVATGAHVELEAFGGRSLAQGLNQPAYQAFEGLEDLVIDQDAYLVGGIIEARLGGILASGRYQREIYRDRSALLSERASFTMSTRPTLGGFALRGQVDYDFGVGRVGKAEVTLSLPSVGSWATAASYRRYVPYFDLSTIWGYFRPVAFDEVSVRTSWNATGWNVWGSGAFRSYGDASTTTVLRPLSDTGWRGSAGAGWTPEGPWSAGATYRLEWAAGGFLSSGQTRVGWAPGESLEVTFTASALQQFEEFRLGAGALVGAGLSATSALGSRVRLQGGGTLFRRWRNRPEDSFDGSQTRFWSEVRIAVGGDPGGVP